MMASDARLPEPPGAASRPGEFLTCGPAGPRLAARRARADAPGVVGAGSEDEPAPDEPAPDEMAAVVGAVHGDVFFFFSSSSSTSSSRRRMPARARAISLRFVAMFLVVLSLVMESETFPGDAGLARRGGSLPPRTKVFFEADGGVFAMAVDVPPAYAMPVHVAQGPHDHPSP
jgi:hypothetical protein